MNSFACIILFGYHPKGAVKIQPPPPPAPKRNPDDILKELSSAVLVLIVGAAVGSA